MNVKKRKNHYKWIELAIVVWTLVAVLAMTVMAADYTGTYSCFSLKASSSGKVEIKATATGWEILAYGTDGSCGSTSTQTVTFTITNTGKKDDGSVRAVDFKITTTGMGTNDTGAAKTLDASTTSLTYTATSGKGSKASTTITIDFANISQESMGATVVTTVKPGTGGTITVDGTAVTAQKDFTNLDSHTYTLTATANSGYTFFGWMSSNGYLTTNGVTSYSYAGKNAETIWPLFVKSDSAMYYINGLYYSFLDEAITAAGSSGTVILHQSGTAYHSDSTKKSFTIPAGVSLLIPYSSANLFRGVPTEYSCKDGTLDTNRGFPDPPEVSIISAKTYGSVSNTEYRRLTLATGTNIIVNGSLEVSGQTHPLAKGQLGAYGLIQMESGSNITVNSGGTLYAWGYIRGSGTVTAQPGATVYEHFDCVDYPAAGAGGMDSLNSAGVFAVRDYTMNNIEVSTTVYAGATYKVYLVVTGYNIGTCSFIRDFIGTTSSAVFNLSSGTITKAYAGGRQIFTIAGTADLNAFSITINYLYIVNYTLNSAKTSGLPFGNAWDITITKDGTVNLTNSVVMYAGATMTIDEGGKLIIPSGIKASILDAGSDPSSAANNAKLNVNGEVQVDGALYTTYSNAAYSSVTSSQGTGKIIVNAVGTETSVVIRGTGDASATCNMTPAKLLNGDSTYLQPSSTGTYVYSTDHQKWAKTAHTFGETTYTGDGKIEYTATRVCACGYTETAKATINCETTPATCTVNGENVYTATFAEGLTWAEGKTTTEVVTAPGHDYGDVTYTWTDYTKCVASRTCKVTTCGYVESVTAEGASITSEVTTPETCKTTGVRTYTANFGVDWATSRKTEEIPVDENAHVWGDTEYAWENDGSACSAKRACTVDGCGLEETATATGISGTVKIPSNCTVMGTTTYTATFAESWAATPPTKDVQDIPTDSSVHADTNKDHICDYGCQVFQGTCEDTNTDHVCDYGAGTEGGCAVYHGTHADADLDHACDYGCTEAIGTCEDANLDHACDYGCDKVFGTCADANKDHICDYSLGAEGGCDKFFGECADGDFDHYCDYGANTDGGCRQEYGAHEDTDLDHTCDYGCKVAIGTCEDANLDHACDYGCDKVFGTCADTDKDHACDYAAGSENGCDKVFGEHEDGDKNHTCDYGCDEAIGDCSDSETDEDHVCDYGCGKVWNDCTDAETDGDHDCDVCGKEDVTVCADGDDNHKCDDCGATTSTCKDDNKDHICDYAGCKATGMGDCVDNNSDHYCDYGAESTTGCREYKGNHADANKDHDCDYGCEEAIGTCEDADKDHYCDYGAEHTDGCRKEYGDHADTTGDKDHICDYCESEEILSNCTGAAAVTENDVAAKCEKDGSYDTVVYCSECGAEMSRTTTTRPATGHTSITDKAVAPTCTATGLTEGSYCSVCGKVLVEQEVVAALGHDYDAVAKDPTCTEGGYTTYTCKVCDHTYVADETAALGHDYDAVVTAPTCTVGGYTTYTCSVCGHTYDGDAVDALGHDYDAVVTAPTCTAEGFTTYTCSVCGDTYVADQTAALGHGYDDGVVTTEPKCEETGIKTFTCTVCDDSYTEPVAATGHTEVADEAVAPTCTATGLTAGSHCSVCGETIVAQNVVDALGHSYTAAVTKEPKCEEEGTKTYTCDNCGDSYEETLGVTGHTWNAGTCSNCGASSENKCEHNYTLQETVDPTCTAAGYTISLCSECGGTKQETTDAATGHAPGDAADCTNNQVCITCGEQLVPALGHNYTTAVTPPTCTEGGYTTYTCSVCGDTYTANETSALGHSPAEAVKENEVAAKCNADGSYDSVVYCSVCETHEISRETIVLPAHGNHTAGDAVVENEKAATCTSSGSYDTVVYCSVCNTQISRNTTTVAALGHTEVADAAVAATCTTAGKTAGSHCSVCGEVVIAQTEIPALGHDETTHNAKAATCTEAGWNTYVTCSRCDYSTYEEIAALGHSYTADVKAPTCTDAGHTTYTCANCGDSYVADEVAALGHSYTETVVEPTCTEDGYTAHICSGCDHSYNTDEVAALGHTEVTESERWTKDGVSYHKTVVTCETCEAELSNTTVAQEAFTDETIPESIKENYPTAEALENALKDRVLTENNSFFTEHKLDKENAVTELYDVALKVEDEYGNWNDVTAEDFPEEGITVKLPIPEGTTLKNFTFFVAHIFTADVNGYKAGEIEYPEVTEVEEDGISYIVFHVYGLSPITVTSVQDCTEGHTYETAVTAPTCTEAGFTIYTCSVCGDTYTGNETAALGHDYNAVVTAPTHASAGYTTYTCNTCSDSYVGDHTEALGHDYVETETPATCTEDGVKTFTCSSCGESYTEVIPATGHNYVDGVCTNCSETEGCEHEAGTVAEENVSADTSSYDLVVRCTKCQEILSCKEMRNLPATMKIETVSVNDSLALNFPIVMADLTGTDYYAVLIRYNPDGSFRERVTYDYDEWEYHDANRQKIVYKGVAAAQMTDFFHVYICNGDGERVSRIYESSVRYYAMRQIKSYMGNSKYNKLVTLLVDMLNYGTAAQNYFGKYTNYPANSELTAEMLTYASSDTSFDGQLVQGVGHISTTATLNNTIELNFYFTKDALGAKETKENLFVVVTYLDRNGNEVKRVIRGSVETDEYGYIRYQDDKDRWSIKLIGLPTAVLAKNLTCEIYTSEDAVLDESTDTLVGYVEDCAAGYLSRKLADLKQDVFKMSLLYLKSVRAYFYG